VIISSYVGKSVALLLTPTLAATAPALGAVAFNADPQQVTQPNEQHVASSQMVMNFP
jgi:hypothetical protein